MFKWSKFLGGFFLFFVVAWASYFSYLFSPISKESVERNFTVSAGAGLNEIAELLEEQDLVHSKIAFKIYSFLSGSAHLLKPGSYSLMANLSTPEIITRLIAGPPDLEVLITEGKTIKEIDQQLSSLGLIKAGELIGFPIQNLKSQYIFIQNANTLEGFLFPDTYRIAPDASAALVLKKILDNFQAKALATLDQNPSWYDNLIIASLIEREIPLRGDRRLVAGLLRERLARGMPLQVDATTVYVKCDGQFDNCPPLTKSDFKIQSPYNTYYYKGLPPAPIANPGLDAMFAAINSESSPFLYYLSDPETQKTIFSETLAEHNANRARYLSR